MLASGITAIAGFAALVSTDIRMLRDFGLVTVSRPRRRPARACSSCLPAALVWAEARLRSRSAPLRGAACAAAAARRRMTRMATGRGKRASPRARYSTFVGIAFLVLIVVADREHDPHRRRGHPRDRATTERGIAAAGVRGPECCAAPPSGDANVSQDDCATSENPCPPDDRRAPRPARSTSHGAIRVCDLFDRPLVISFWFTRGADCLPTQDVVDRVADALPGRVNFLSIDVRDDRDEVAADRRRARLDASRSATTADGAVANLYRVGVCPTVAFAYPGGILEFAKLGSDELSEPTADRRRPSGCCRESRERAESER